MVTTADQQEIDNFAALSDKWWDPGGPMATLHSFTPVRISYILASIERFWPTASRPDANQFCPLKGLSILDIGCGGGLLAEPMARLGGNVTGIDITEKLTKVATTHATQSGLDIHYECNSVETLAHSGVTYDVIYASEVIEHVSNRTLFIEAIASILHPNGVVIITTINRSIPALLFAKFAMEYVIRLIPPGTHNPKKFIRPGELQEEFSAFNIILDDLTGLTPQPGGGFRQTGNLAINYAASGGFA